MEIKEIHADSLDDVFFKQRYDRTCGAVYIAEYKNGYIKIGSTASPKTRYMQLAYVATEYAGAEINRLAITNPISNYKKLELVLHKRFEEQNVRKELFSIRFEDAIQMINKEFSLFDELKKDIHEYRSMEILEEIIRSEKREESRLKALLVAAFIDGMKA